MTFRAFCMLAMSSVGAVLVCTAAYADDAVVTPQPPADAQGVQGQQDHAACLESIKDLPDYLRAAFLDTLCNNENGIDRRDYKASQPPPILNYEYFNFEIDTMYQS